jgi:ADP-ribose pyrophosphatase
VGSNILVELERERVRYRFGTLFRIVEARLRYLRWDGEMSEPVTRVNFERGAAAGVLLYDPAQDAVALVEQFRYPVYAGLLEETQEKHPEQAWLLEVVAGTAEGDRTQADVARRELLEEAGYAVSDNLHPIAAVYPSPGGSSEVIHLYWAEVAIDERAQAGGGLAREGEDTRVVVLPFAQALAMIGDQIQDAKTILCLQHLKLRQLEVVG